MIEIPFICNILEAHSKNCISLSTIIQVMVVSYLMISYIYSVILYPISNKSKNNKIGYLKSIHNGKQKFVNLTSNIIYTTLLFSLTLIFYKLITINKEPSLALFFIILNSTIIMMDILLFLGNSFYVNNYYTDRYTLLGIFPVMIHNIFLYNIIALLGFYLIVKGWNNIVIPPVYAIAFFKYV